MYAYLRYFLILVVLGTSGAVYAKTCPSYESVTDKLKSSYREHKLFSGFSKPRSEAGADSHFEFWSNAESGSWTLLVQKLVIFRDGENSAPRNCTYLIASGLDYRHFPGAAAKTTESTGEASPVSGACRSHEEHASVLQERYSEWPIVRAITKDHDLLGIYAGGESWTILTTKVTQLNRPSSGVSVRGGSNGQEVHGLCSRAIADGLQWSIETAPRYGAI